MLNDKGHSLLRQVEHVEDHDFFAVVLAVVNGVHCLNDSIALMECFFSKISYYL